jgi:hypothetical protein
MGEYNSMFDEIEEPYAKTPTNTENVSTFKYI